MEEQLIEFVRKNKCLYDKSNPHYKVIHMRDTKFEELSQKLNIPAKKLKARWRTLRDTFHKEIKAESFECVSSTKKQWKWMERLMFLKNLNSSNSSTPVPMKSSFRKTREYHRFANIGEDTTTNELTSETKYISDPIEYDEQISTFPTPEREPNIKFDPMTDESRNETMFNAPANNDVLEHRDTKVNTRSAIQLFFAGLAKQTEDAHLTPKEFAQLQLKLLQVFNKQVYDV